MKTVFAPGSRLRCGQHVQTAARGSSDERVDGHLSVWTGAMKAPAQNYCIDCLLLVALVSKGGSGSETLEWPNIGKVLAVTAVA